jgi:hypothetical protein
VWRAALASRVPDVGPVAGEVHFVLCSFDQLGTAFVETDPDAAGREDIVRNLIAGQYSHPLRVIAVDLARGRVRDVSAEVAAAVETTGSHDPLPPGTQAFVAAQRGRVPV